MAKGARGGGWAAAGRGCASVRSFGLLAIDLDLTALVSFTRDRTLLVAGRGGRGRPPLAHAAAQARGRGDGRGRRPVARRRLHARSWRGWPTASSAAIPSARADAVFVFGSRLQTDGEPTQDAMSRLLKGLELVAEGRAPRLVVSELYPPSKRLRADRSGVGEGLRAESRGARGGAGREHARRGRPAGPAPARARAAPRARRHLARAHAARRGDARAGGARGRSRCRASRRATTSRRSTTPATAGGRSAPSRTSGVGLFVYARRGWVR